MRRAIELARGHRTHPNPRVGAVVVDPDGALTGEGFHEGPGSDHAEIRALAAAGDEARGATMFVTLEPCNHHGRTPPCVEAIVAAGINQVVVGVVDPDTRVSGSGISALIDAGIPVTVWDSPGEIEETDPGYFHHRRTGLPLVRLKYAMTLDGSAAAADGSSQWITSEEARADAHRMRGIVDAVVIGAGTVRKDDPRLDVRLDGFEGTQPLPVIVAGSQALPIEAQLWSRDPLVYSTSKLDLPGGENIVVSGGQFPAPAEVARDLAGRGLLEVLLEGGPILASAWWGAGVVASGVVYIGARMGGGAGSPPLSGVFAAIDDARPVAVTDVRLIGGDVRIEFQ